MKELRIHVERIVRPIRASVPRKNKMREELLAHLKTAFEEERISAEAETEAIERAQQRLGDPDSLRKELQASVPWYERLGHTRLPVRLEMVDYGLSHKRGWRASARFATEVIVCTIAGSPILFAIGCLVPRGYRLNGPDLANLPGMLIIVGGFLACLWFSLFVTFWLFDLFGAGKRVAPWSRTPAPIKACLATLLWMFAIGLFLAVSIGFADFVQPRGTPDGVATILLAAVTAIPYGPWLGLALLLGSILTLSIANHFERRQYEAWGCLDIEDDAKSRC